ncbi:MAG: Mu transposase C-terminal domain-containing protein [Planctomycetes bacterium]|nr:Mu transposase C-terminal domain-containing protein [Planctomycetota bacterium]
MTSAAAIQPRRAIPLAAPPPGYLSSDRAAAILGYTPRHVARLAAEGRLAAECVDGPRGRSWYIDPACRAEFRLATGDLGPTMVPAGDVLASLTERQREAVYARHSSLQAYLSDASARPAGVSIKRFRAAWIAAWNHAYPAADLSPRTLERHIAAFRRQGISGLVDGRGACGSDQATTPDALDFIKGAYLDQVRPSLRSCWELALALAPSKGWKLASYPTIARRISHDLDPKVLVAGRNPKLYRDRMDLAITRDWSLVPAMSVWVADHRQLDILVPRQSADTGKWSWARPWLTCFLDCRSWYPVAWTISWDSPDANRVMATFIRAVRLYGLPEWLYLDNGKDFRAGRFSGGRREGGEGGRFVPADAVEPILTALGVDVVWATPYNARAKTIENFFGTQMARQFDKRFATYAGHRSDSRPERIKGERAAETAAAGLTIDTVREAFGQWVDEDYALAECPLRASRGFSTLRAFRHLRSADFAVRRPAEETLRMLLLPTKPIAVGRSGLKVRELGRAYWSPELENRRAAGGRRTEQKVVVRYDPADPGQVYVFDASGRFLDVAVPWCGDGVHPLVRSADAAEQARLTEAIAMQRSSTKAVTAEVRRYRATVEIHAPGLRVAREARRGLGRLDTEAAAEMGLDGPVDILIPIAGVDQAAQAAETAARRRRARADHPASLTAEDVLAARRGLKQFASGAAHRGVDALDLLVGEPPNGEAKVG